MTSMSALRTFAARRHHPQQYDDGVPYWIHLLICELVARAFFPGDEQLLQAVWGHDLLEDTKTRWWHLLFAGFCLGAILDIRAVTDQPGRNRAERKARTLPVIRKRGASAIKLKLCDRIANVLYGLATGNTRKRTMYRHEQVALEAALFDAGQTELLPAWNFLRQLLSE